MFFSASILSFLFAFALGRLTSIVPTQGPYSSTADIYGTDFTPSITTCLFTDQQTSIVYQTPFTYISSTHGKCLVPSLASGAPTTDVYTLMLSGITGHCPNFIITSGTGYCDPHFTGFHGEKMEVKRDELAANQLFHLYCSPSITITTLFYEYPDKLLFMTKFWVRLGETIFTLDLSTRPKMISTGHSEPYFMQDLGRYRIDIPDGHLEWDDSKLRVVYNYLLINFSTKLYLNNAPYMNIDINTRNPNFEDTVTGIIGRTLHRKLSDKEFENYYPFKASVSDVIDFSCSLLLNKIQNTTSF